MLLNCDMGESFGIWKMGDDDLIMPYIDVANIACGMHASDPCVMLKTIKNAKKHHVSIAAHPGYPDLQGFGRRNIIMNSQELFAYVLYQIGALTALCDSEEVSIDYIKVHGALYHAMMQDMSVFETIVHAISTLKNPATMVAMAVPHQAKLIQIAKKYHVGLIFEAFLDRAYLEDGSLAPRNVAGAVHHDMALVKQQAMQLIDQGSVVSMSGQLIKINAQTLCVHGDGIHALEIAEFVRSYLRETLR